MVRGRRVALGVAVAALMVGGGVATAAPGDVHRVTGEKVNLRAGPSDDANVRGQVQRGDEVVELTRQGDWLGVRSMSTGVEGWIYGGLTEVSTRSSLSGGEDGGLSGAARTAGFEKLSPEFDTLLAGIGQHMGMRLFESATQGKDGVLRLKPSEEFLTRGSPDAHLLAALAAHQMWKNFNNGRPVRVAMSGPRGRDYIGLNDGGPQGPVLDVVDWGRSAQRQGENRADQLRRGVEDAVRGHDR